MNHNETGRRLSELPLKCAKLSGACVMRKLLNLAVKLHDPRVEEPRESKFSSINKQINAQLTIYKRGFFAADMHQIITAQSIDERSIA